MPPRPDASLRASSPVAGPVLLYSERGPAGGGGVRAGGMKREERKNEGVGGP